MPVSKFSKLGRRMVGTIILASAGFTLISSGIQLYEMYRRDTDAVFQVVETIKVSFRVGLEGALWEFNFDQVELLLDGILAQPNIVFVKLNTPTGQSWQIGNTAQSDTFTDVMSLEHVTQDGQIASVGKLELGVSFANALGHLRSQLITIALTNFFRSLAVAFLILIIFERVTARHLRRISESVSAQPWLQGDSDLELNRKRRSDGDELDGIVDALNLARRQTKTTYEELFRQKETLDELNAELQQANKEQSEFTYAISHDLKSLINTLEMLFRELTEDENADDPASVHDLLNDIDQTLDRMRRLIEGTLRYSQSVEADGAFECVDLDALLVDVQADLDADIRAAGAKIIPDRLGSIFGNAAHLRMLLQNLVSNAIKFRRHDVAPIVEFRNMGVSELDEDVQRSIWFSVSDNGIGINPKNKDKIFGLFKRLHTRADFAGDGIGLAVCKRIAMNHGGTVTLDETAKSGATFCVNLGSEGQHGPH